MRVVFLMGAATLALTLGALGACWSGPPSATSRGPAPPAAPPSASAPGPATAAAPGVTASADPRDAPVPPADDGKPMWAANRRYTAEQNADYQFQHHGREFNAVTEVDYLRMVHAFIDSPPSGVQRLQRSNGDELLYDAKSNTFAVVTSDGAPRTMQKPQDGAAYWRQQARDNARSNSEDSSSQG